MKIGENIRKIREAKKMSREDVAKNLGIGRQMLEYVERGVRKGLPDWFFKLPDALNCSFMEIFNEKVDNINSVKLKYFLNVETLDDNKDFVEREKEIMYLEFNEDFLIQNKIKDYKNILITRAAGNNMYPTIEDKDFLFVDTNKRELFNGKIYVIKEKNEFKIKRLLQPNPNKPSITVISDNANKLLYPDYNVDMLAGEAVNIIGQVVMHCNTL
jgi:transcriptional regulator with XRE-family HTH domain